MKGSRYKSFQNLLDVEKFKKDYANRIKIDGVVGGVWAQAFFGMKSPVTENLKFRKACAYAVNRETVTQAATRGYTMAYGKHVKGFKMWATNVPRLWGMWIEN